MQIRGDQLAQHLAGGLKRIYTVHGDEPLLAQEAGDAIRAAAREAGHVERQVHTVAGNHFDWSGLLGAAQALSLFATRQLVEIRIPSGKPGKEGSDALQRYCAVLSDDVVTLVTLPKLDRMQTNSAWFGALDAAGVTLRVEPIERAALPQWIARRLDAQGQRVASGEEGQRALAFFADRIEGNLLAANQEIVKLGLLYAPGTLSLEQIESAIVDVARYDIPKLADSVLVGQAARALRMLDGLRDEGEAAARVHYTLASDILSIQHVKAALDTGAPMPMALREARVWGSRERMVERAVGLVNRKALSDLVDAAQICDGVIKGLSHPAWPNEPWAALRRLTAMMCSSLGNATVRSIAMPENL